MSSFPQTTTPFSGAPTSLPPLRGTGAALPNGNMSNLSAYGVNLTPPSPISYSVSGNMGNISNVIGQVNTAQNAANQANNQRYTQQLGVLSQGAQGLNQYSQGAIQDATTGYNNAVGSLGNSLANDQTVYSNQAQQATHDAVNASGNARQDAVSRGLSNTTIADSLQQGVQQTKNLALSNIAAAKAQSDNTVYQNLANIYQNQGTTTANLDNQAGSNYMTGANSISSAIANRTDQAPNISDYASIIEAAQAAQNSTGRSTITTTTPNNSSLSQEINNPGVHTSGTATGGGSGGGLSGGISSSQGQGGFNSSGGGTTAQYFGPGYGNPNANPSNSNPDQSIPIPSDSGAPRPAPGPISSAASGTPAPQTPQDATQTGEKDPNWDYTPGAMHSDGAWKMHNDWLAAHGG